MLIKLLDNVMSVTVNVLVVSDHHPNNVLLVKPDSSFSITLIVLTFVTLELIKIA